MKRYKLEYIFLSDVIHFNISILYLIFFEQTIASHFNNQQSLILQLK